MTTGASGRTVAAEAVPVPESVSREASESSRNKATKISGTGASTVRSIRAAGRRK